MAFQLKKGSGLGQVSARLAARVRPLAQDRADRAHEGGVAARGLTASVYADAERGQQDAEFGIVTTHSLGIVNS